MKHFKRMIIPLRREPILVVVSIIVGTLSACINLIRPQLLGWIVNAITTRHPILALVILYTASWIVTWVLSTFLINRLCTLVNQRILKSLRGAVLDCYLSLPLERSEQMPKGRIEAYIMSDIPTWCSLYGIVLVEVIHSIAQFCFSLIVLNHVEYKLTLTITPLLILSAVVPFAMRRRVQETSKQVQDANSNVFEVFSEVINGVRDIVINHAYNWAMARCFHASEAVSKSKITKVSSHDLLQIFSSSFEVFAYIFTLALGSRYVLWNQITIGELVAFLATIEMLFFPTRYAGYLFSSIQSSLAAAKRVWEFLDWESLDEKPISEGMRVENVSFRYPDSTDYCLKNISCTIEPGELVIIVGDSGSGKSTFLNLLAGLYHPTEGAINPIGAVGIHSASVWQDINFFQGSVSDNLLMGRDVHIDPELMSSINLSSVIDNMGGYYGRVLDNGINFSGGERQRLALVRAIVSRPELLILDEPTATLDPENEKIIWDLIRNLKMTRIVSTHKLRHIKVTDKILVLSKGNLVGVGMCKQPNSIEMRDS